jgi:RNA polymerase sigma-70 factor (ECF subfamily)
LTLRRILRDRRHSLWLAAAKRGESLALQRLYRELFDPIARYLDARLERPEDVEDLTSRVFHRFVERLDRYEPGRGSVVAWVLSMAHSALVDHYRARRPEVPADELVESLAGRSPGPLDALLRRERARLVHGLIGELPAETRRMLALRFDQDLRYGEIATCMGLSEAAVKQRFSRTLRELRRRLAARRSDGDEVTYAV